MRSCPYGTEQDLARTTEKTWYLLPGKDLVIKLRRIQVQPLNMMTEKKAADLESFSVIQSVFCVCTLIQKYLLLAQGAFTR